MNGPRPSSTGSKIAKGVGFGCGGIFLFGSYVIANLTGNFSGFLFFLAIFAVLIFVSMRKGKNPNQGVYAIPSPTLQSSTGSTASASSEPLPAAVVSPPRPDFGVREGYLQSPLCIHSFLDDGFDSRGMVQCPCGFAFKRNDLIEYRSLLQLRANVDAKLSAITEKIWVSSQGSASTEQASSTITTKAVKPDQPTKPAKVRAVRPKVNLSLQQWLIIGAAALVIVAGSVFVSTNIDTMPQWVFQLITIGIAVATAFGAMKLKSVSAILSNFLALFSSAMQLATMTIVADQLDSTWIWPDLPPAWWAFSLGTVAIFSIVLSRFSKNFGWKAIAVINITGTGLFFVMGAMRGWLQNSTFVFSLTLIAFTGFMLAQILASRYLRGLKNEISEGENSSYEKELAEREDNALRRYALYAVSLFVVVSIGYAVYIAGFDPTSMRNLWEPWTTILFGLIWVTLAMRPKFWAVDFSSDGKGNPIFETIAWVIGYSATALGLSRLASSTENSWASLAVNVLGAAALILIPKFVSKFSPKSLAIDVAMWMSFATGLLWTTSSWSWNDSFGGAYMVAYALVFTLGYWANGRSYLAQVSTASASLGAIWLLITVANTTEGSQTLSLVALGMLAVVNLLPQVQRRVAVAAKANFAEKAQTGVAFTSSAVIVATMLYRVSDTIGGSIWILMSLVAYLVAALALAQRNQKSDAKSPLIPEIHSYIAQLGVLFVVGNSLNGDLNTVDFGPVTVTLLVLAALNYGYSVIATRSRFVHIGYAAVIATSLSGMYQMSDLLKPSMQIAVTVAATTLVAFLQFTLSKRFKDQSERLIWQTPLIGAVALMLVGVTLAYQGVGELASDAWVSIGAFAVGTLATLFWFELRKEKKHALEAKLATGLATIYTLANLALVTILNVSILGFDQNNCLQQITVYALASLVIIRVNRRSPSFVLVALGFAANLVIAINAALVLRLSIPGVDVPELYAIFVAASLIGSSFGFSKQLAGRRTVVVDLAVLVALGYSSAVSLMLGIGSETALIRGIVEFALLTAYAYFRALKAKSIVWFAAGYGGGIASAILIVNELSRNLNIEWHGAEFHSMAIIGSMLVGNRLLKKVREVKSVDLNWGIPLAVLALPMISQGTLIQGGTLEGFIRATLGLLFLTVYAYWRTGTTKDMAWLISGYGLGGLTAVSLGSSISTFWLTSYQGPELVSALLTLSIFIGHRYLRMVRKTGSTLLLWGLPATALLLPSAIYTSTTAGLDFSSLTGDQITRSLAVLTVSGLALLVGFRAGNRGLAYSGVIGLAVLTWVHAALLAPEAVVEFRSIVIGAVLMTALSSLRKAGKLPGNSLVWLGIPISIAMLPAIFNSLTALTNNELSSVDWWRFGIVVTASAVLLIAGALREIAGMFFPGLVGVVLAALPYGFKRVQQESWFLWVLLLAIAGIMVWIAVRMDQLRKQGKSSATWLKELK